jgi:hypothetical protein
MTIVKWFLILLGIGVALWIAWGFISWHVWEKPDYEVIKKFDEVEVRKYGPLTEISTVAPNSNMAFSKLADYIFKGNRQKEKIAMTAPVYTEKEGGNIRMKFYLPEGYDTTNAPLPNNSEVKIGVQQGQTIGVIRFRGLYDEEKFEAYRQILLDELKRNNVKTQGDAFVLRYDDPWVPPFMRRNEVGVLVN